MPASAAFPRFQRASDQSLLIYFDHQISLAAHEQLRKLLHLLELQPIPGVCNLHPAYCSLLIKFHPLAIQHEDLESTLRSYLQRLDAIILPEPRQVEIPACYGGDFGPDLTDVAKHLGLTIDRVIDLHSSAAYLVYFLGFVPGFAYLGELPPALIIPRLAAPRRKVPAGSIGIAGNQTGVYPVSTPGGWRLLGRTPWQLFRSDRQQLSLLSIGDRVRFIPISAERFAQLEPGGP
jgi:KipI family sensor histidine kinase inhibitor